MKKLLIWAGWRASKTFRVIASVLCHLFALSLALLSRLSSSDPDAKSFDMYSSTTTFQPSTLLSAILISFCRFQINSFPSFVKSLTTPLAPSQGRNEVYFFIADPVILPKFLIPASKRDENFDPLSRKILLIQNAWSLIQWKTPLIPIPGVMIPDPGSHPFFSPWSLIPYNSLRPCHPSLL